MILSQHIIVMGQIVDPQLFPHMESGVVLVWCRQHAQNTDTGIVVQAVDTLLFSCVVHPGPVLAMSPPLVWAVHYRQIGQ